MEVAAEMSLINQVLRDLDRRQAGTAAAMPATVKPMPMGSKSASARLRRGAVLSLASFGVVGVAVAWSLNAPLPAVSAAAAAPTVVAAAPVSTPVVVVMAASAAAPMAQPEGIQAEPAPVRRRAPRVSAPAPAQAASAADIDTTTLAVATMATPSRSVPATLEPRIEKRAPSRTARERAEAAFQRGASEHQQGHIDDALAAYTAALTYILAFGATKARCPGRAWPANCCGCYPDYRPCSARTGGPQ